MHTVVSSWRFLSPTSLGLIVRMWTNGNWQGAPLFLLQNYTIMGQISLNLPANMALCAWNSLPPTANVTSENLSLSNRAPKSSDNLHSGTLNWTTLLCPLMLILSATTDTSQNIVNLSSGKSPFASSSRKSLKK